MAEVRIDAPCGVLLAPSDGAVVRATGIPYATARRFHAPEPVPRWSRPRPASAPSPASPQEVSPLLERVLGPGYLAERQDEDCQHLSVTAPDEPDGGPFPVLVWIHGGSYTSGSGDAPLTDPAPLVREQRVVVVTVTYRLGVLGYLGDGADRPANLGLLDQVAALRWVQENIRAFGGDPGTVTVFGQSAGADAIAHLMALPDAPRLFRRAIVQSAPPRSPSRRRVTDAMAAATRGLGAEASIPEVLAAQRTALRAAAAFGASASMPFGVEYGRDPLPPWQECERARARNAPAIDLLVGRTADEARLFFSAVPALDRAARLPVVGPVLRHLLSRALTQAVYGRSVRRLARAHAAAGGRGYRYRLDWPRPAGPYGAAHTVDLALLLGSAQDWAGTGLLHGVPPEQVHAAATRLRQVWADFARDGRPARLRVPGVVTLRRLRTRG